LTRATTIEFNLKIVFCERNKWWAAVDDDPDTASVGFAEG
jgi:hypothetical protein